LDYIGNNFALNIFIADLKYAGNLHLKFFDFNTGKFTSFERVLLPHKVPELTNTSFLFDNSSNDIVYKDGDITFKILNDEKYKNSPYQLRYVIVASESDKIELIMTLNMTKDHEIIGIV